MNSKKKLIISLLVVAFLLISIIATVAIAFALSQQTIKTNLNIRYQVQDIDGTASATYTIGGVTENLTAMKGENVIGETLVFKAGDKQNAGNLMFPEDALALTAQNDNVVIQYTYSNTGAKHYIASMSFDGNIEADNMKVEYSIDGVTYSEDRYAVVVPANTINRSYWIKISIEDKAKSASFTGDFNWLLNACDPQNKDYLSLTSLEFKGSDGVYSASIAEGTTAGEYTAPIVFPSEVNGDTVTTISASSLTDAQKAQVTSVYIPDSVTTIGENAFYGFGNLKTVTLEQNENAVGASTASVATGLKSIEKAAFNSTGLKEFVIPNTVETLGWWVFANSALVSVEIPGSITHMDPEVFINCYNLTNLTIGSGLLTLDPGQFLNCTNLKNITTHTLNDSVVSAIRSLANTNSEMDLTIGEGVTSISENAFKDCVGLTSVTISESVTKISQLAFSGSSLTSVNLNNGLVEIGNGAFSECQITEIVIPDTVTTIGGLAFESCGNLSTVIIGSAVTRIESSAFIGCENLTSVTFKNTSGWTAGSISISATDLANVATAASYLTSTYRSNVWTCA